MWRKDRRFTWNSISTASKCRTIFFLLSRQLDQYVSSILLRLHFVAGIAKNLNIIFFHSSTTLEERNQISNINGFKANDNSNGDKTKMCVSHSLSCRDRGQPDRCSLDRPTSYEEKEWKDSLQCQKPMPSCHHLVSLRWFHVKSRNFNPCSAAMHMENEDRERRSENIMMDKSHKNLINFYELLIRLRL